MREYTEEELRRLRTPPVLLANEARRREENLWEQIMEKFTELGDLIQELDESMNEQ